jgi:hypothetical protein
MVAELPQGQIPVLVDQPADQVGPARSRYLMVIPPLCVGAALISSSVPKGLTPGDLWNNVAAPLWDDEVIRTCPCVSHIVCKSSKPSKASKLRMSGKTKLPPNERQFVTLPAKSPVNDGRRPITGCCASVWLRRSKLSRQSGWQWQARAPSKIVLPSSSI